MSTKVTLTLPSYFADIEIMKRNSYPFSHAFTRLLKALKTVQDETDMPFYLLVGQIEAESGQDFAGPDNGNSFKFTYIERDPEACQFLKDNAKENGESVKNIVIRILQMCLRLRMGGYPSFDAIANLTLFGAQHIRADKRSEASFFQDNQRPVNRDVQRYEPSRGMTNRSVKRSVARSSQRKQTKAKASQEVKKEADYGDAKGKSSGDVKKKSRSVASSNPASSNPASNNAAESTVDQDKQETLSASKHPGLTIKKGKGKKENKPEISDSTRELLNKSKAKREELEERAKEQENMKEKLEGAVVETNSLLSSFLR